MDSIITPKLNTSLLNSSNFNSKKVNNKLQHFNSNNDQQNKKDPLMNYPLRLCAYSNEVGAAILPLPGVGHTLFMLSWIPSLMYFGADIYDKYAKGKENDYSNPDKGNAFKQTIFQALASVVLPTLAVIGGQNVASHLSKYLSKDKLDIRAKDDILIELKRDLNQNKLRKHRLEFEKILRDNPGLSIQEVTNLPEVRNIHTGLTEQIFNDIKTESESLQMHRKAIGPWKKFVEFFTPKRNCEYVSKVPEQMFEQKVKPYLSTQLKELISTRLELQKALNADGTLNINAQKLTPGMLKKVEKLLKKNMKNKDIKNKSSFVVKECVTSKLQKTALKLSGFKILGGFISLALLAKPIDKFVEHVIIPKFVEPRIK